MSNEAELLYKTTNYYNKDYDRSIKWNDQDLKINWPNQENILLSAKDMNALSFDKADLFE